MTWSINLIGTRRAVREKIKKANLPICVADMIDYHLKPEISAPNGVKVEGFGHTNNSDGSFYSNISRLEITPITLELNESDAYPETGNATAPVTAEDASLLKG